MAETAKDGRFLRFGVFEVDTATGELRRQGMKVRLQEQPSQVLLMLLQRPGEVVSREELCRKLWPADTFVDFDQGLGTALRKLRQALGDDAESPRYIETVPKRGFRFLVPLQQVPAAAEDATTWAGNTPTNNANRPGKRFRPAWLVALAVILLALSFTLGWWVRSHRWASEATYQFNGAIRTSVLPPPNWFFEHSSFSISPDGTRLAFVAVAPDGTDKLWIRTLSSSNAQPVNGTDGALLPFWSTDNRHLGFFAAGKLSVVDLESGAVRILCEAPFARGGGAWSSNGTVVFSPSVAGPLYRISDTGGSPSPATRMTKPSPGQRHMWPSFLPDGVHFFYAESSGPADPQGEKIYVGSLNGDSPKLVISNTAGNVAYASGYLLYGRDHTLWAQPFDVSRLQLTGNAKSVTSQELDQELSFSHGEFSASQTGTIVFQSLSDVRTGITWFDKTGREISQVGEPGYREPRISPDGRFLAFASDDEHNGKFYIRAYDLQRAISTRLTDGGTDRSPAWSHDGKRITFTTLHEIEDVPADGSAPPRVLLKDGVYLGHMDWSPDDHLVFTDFSSGLPSLNIYSSRDGHVEPFAIGAEGRFSPDGRWIAYVGPLSAPDTDAIFVAPYPASQGRIRVSTGSGAQPMWSHDGKQLFYIAPDRKLMAVAFDASAKVAGAPRALFQTSILAPNFADTQYAVSADGRFLINSLHPNDSSPLTLIVGWTASLRNREP